MPILEFEFNVKSITEYQVNTLGNYTSQIVSLGKN
ncbi:MAG: hypothetical protein ACJAWV_000986 [Flammeovirgaceae bacterium]|jgi:hypothetical protein